MLKDVATGKRRTALGQGLDALIPLTDPFESKSSDEAIRFIDVDSLVPNNYQPRRLFDEQSLADLADSIKEKGVIQPLIVRAASGGKYEIVAGERRWRAAQIAGFENIPVIVRELSDAESLEIAIVENIQREDLNPLDTAEAYDILIKKFSYTHEVLAKRIGKDRTSITNQLRILRLPDPVKEEIRQERISMGHARTLLAVDHLPTQLALSKRIIQRKLSVRELERIVQNFKDKQKPVESSPRAKNPATSLLETNLARHLSTRVTLHQKPDGSGRLELHFHSIDELARLLETLGYSEDFS